MHQRLVGAELDGLVEGRARPLGIPLGQQVELGDQDQGLCVFRVHADPFLQVGQRQRAVLRPVGIRALAAEDGRRRGRAALNVRGGQQAAGEGTVGLVDPFVHRALGQPYHFAQIGERVGGHLQLGGLVQIGLPFVGGLRRAGRQQPAKHNAAIEKPSKRLMAHNSLACKWGTPPL